MNEVADYGPKMRGLTEKQRGFVMAMVSAPGMPQWKYAEMAGYAGGVDTWKGTACLLLQRKDINDAINECAGMRLRSGALVAAEVLVRIASDETASAGARMKASEALLDRVGLAPQQNIQVDHTHTDRTGAALMDRIRELAAKHGLDPERLLGGNVPREIELKATAQPASGAEVSDD
jgi:hypothetical protein